MKETRLTMGMPASISIEDPLAEKGIESTFAYFDEIDRRFSPYRADSEVSALNQDAPHVPSAELAEILVLAERTRIESGGFFNIRRLDGFVDPSGIVKGWAIQNAVRFLIEQSYRNFCIDVGGDIACFGTTTEGTLWSIGISNPFKKGEIVKTLSLTNKGVATSGSAARGDHIYNPHDPETLLRSVASITIVGPDVLTVDRYATAAFAMGESGIRFIEAIPDCEAYQIGSDGIAVMTSGFKAYTA